MNRTHSLSGLLSLCAGLAILVSGASNCNAHPGHGIVVTEPSSPVHYFVQPDHSLPYVMLALGCGWMLAQAMLRARVRSTQN